MELTPTARVILGMLGLGPMCGYELKRFVDDSTKYFWAASYGQIYPELRRLSDAGLIAGRPDPNGHRKRIEFSLTDAGREALRSWLTVPAQIHQIRDEALLKLFFSDFAGPAARTEALLAKRDRHRTLAAELRAIEAARAPVDRDSSAYAALRYGIACNEFAAEWCEHEAARDPAPATGRPA